MDLSMPRKYGWQALEEIRKDAGTAPIPVVAVTAHDPDGRDWRAAGFRAYLRKPVEPRRLLDVVREFLPPPAVDP